MKDIQVSEKTFRRLLALKNRWSFNYRKVTNEDVIEKLEALKMEIFGYGSDTSPEEIEKICNKKTRDQLEEESERFQRALRTLLNSGHDFEPEYTLDLHLRKMIELIEEGDEIGTPIF
jgi:predicted CopG family antitoxin